MAAAALSTADSLAIDGLYSSAIDAYTEVICLTDDRASSDTPQSPDATDRLTLRFLALSHRCAAHMALSQHKAAYNDAKEALSLIDMNRYDFAPTGSGSRTGKKLRYEQVAQGHDRAAASIMALNETKAAEMARGYWENALTLAAMGENEELAERYQNCLAVLSSSGIVGKKESDENPIVEEVEKPIVEVVEKTNESNSVVKADSNKPKPVSKSAPSASTTADQTPKYQYYQDATWMKIQIIEPNLTAETCSVSITANFITVSVKKSGSTFTVIHGDLSEAVVPEKCRTLYKEEKVLIKLKKVEEGEWYSLLDDKKKKTAPQPTAGDKGEEKTEETTKPKSMPRPYASHKDWDAIDRDLKAAEEAEKPEGEEALNTLFKQIYANANEDTRRAMVKSMQTSGGTVLSTNWDEVKEADYEKERVAPKGMEWKNYEGDKLKMKEDD
jgi:suppressor of G2 allele of SKP1